MPSSFKPLTWCTPGTLPPDLRSRPPPRINPSLPQSSCHLVRVVPRHKVGLWVRGHHKERGQAALEGRRRCAHHAAQQLPALRGVREQRSVGGTSGQQRGRAAEGGAAVGACSERQAARPCRQRASRRAPPAPRCGSAGRAGQAASAGQVRPAQLAAESQEQKVFLCASAHQREIVAGCFRGRACLAGQRHDLRGCHRWQAGGVGTSASVEEPLAARARPKRRCARAGGVAAPAQQAAVGRHCSATTPGCRWGVRPLPGAEKESSAGKKADTRLLGQLISGRVPHGRLVAPQGGRGGVELLQVPAPCGGARCMGGGRHATRRRQHGQAGAGVHWVQGSAIPAVAAQQRYTRAILVNLKRTAAAACAAAWRGGRAAPHQAAFRRARAPEARSRQDGRAAQAPPGQGRPPPPAAGQQRQSSGALAGCMGVKGGGGRCRRRRCKGGAAAGAVASPLQLALRRPLAADRLACSCEEGGRRGQLGLRRGRAGAEASSGACTLCELKAGCVW